MIENIITGVIIFVTIGLFSLLEMTVCNNYVGRGA